jgi:hypothetical protein
LVDRIWIASLCSRLIRQLGAINRHWRSRRNVDGAWRDLRVGRKAYWAIGRASRAAPLPPSYTITTDTTEIMTESKLLRMDNVGIAVESLDDAISFFTELGLTLEGRAMVEGEWAGRVTGLGNQRVEIAMMVTPDGHSRLELSRGMDALLDRARLDGAFAAHRGRPECSVVALAPELSGLR